MFRNPFSTPIVCGTTLPDPTAAKRRVADNIEEEEDEEEVEVEVGGEAEEEQEDDEEEVGLDIMEIYQEERRDQGSPRYKR